MYIVKLFPDDFSASTASARAKWGGRGMVPVGHVSGRPPDRPLVAPGPPKGTHTKVLSREAPRPDDLQAPALAPAPTPLYPSI